MQLRGLWSGIRRHLECPWTTVPPATGGHDVRKIELAIKCGQHLSELKERGVMTRTVPVSPGMCTILTVCGRLQEHCLWILMLPSPRIQTQQRTVITTIPDRHYYNLEETCQDGRFSTFYTICSPVINIKINCPVHIWTFKIHSSSGLKTKQSKAERNCTRRFGSDLERDWLQSQQQREVSGTQRRNGGEEATQVMLAWRSLNSLWGETESRRRPHCHQGDASRKRRWTARKLDQYLCIWVLILNNNY